MDCRVHGVTKSQTRLSDFYFHMIHNLKNYVYSIQFLSPGNKVSLLGGKPCYQCVPTDIFQYTSIDIPYIYKHEYLFQ